MKNPAKERPYLTDAGYYRLGYQLAAQLMNALAEADSRESVRSRAISREKRDPLFIASRLLEETRLVLSWYEARVEAFMRWHRLAAREVRLRRFLAETIEPCCALIVARCLYDRGRPEEAAEHVEFVSQREEAGTLSYRAYYALACLEANVDATAIERSALVPRHGGAAVALDHLHRALRDAPGDRRAPLARWATRDPAFGRLRSAVDTLAEPFTLRTAPLAPATPADEVVKSERELLAVREVANPGDSQMIEAIKQLALAYQRAGRSAEAIDLLEGAIYEFEGQPLESATLRIALASEYQRVGRVDDAITHDEVAHGELGRALGRDHLATAAAGTVVIMADQLRRRPKDPQVRAYMLEDRERLLRLVPPIAS
jgi:tetratricopeptide (TPR) repeat protein